MYVYESSRVVFHDLASKAGLGDAMEKVIKKELSASYSISFITRIALLLCVEINMMHCLSEGMAGNFVPVHRTINLLSPQKILPNVTVIGGYRIRVYRKCNCSRSNRPLLHAMLT